MQGHGTGGTGLLGLGGRRNKGTGHMVEVVLGGRSTLYHVYKRPFVDYFLRKVDHELRLCLVYETHVNAGFRLVYFGDIHRINAGICRSCN